MDIDFHSETILTLGQAAGLFPPYREGRPVNPSTIFRWIVKGVKRWDGTVVYLGGVRCGDRWLTSREAVARFIEMQTPDVAGKRPLPPTTNGRKRAAIKAGERLTKLGI
jgi:hypothetical protein